MMLDVSAHVKRTDSVVMGTTSLDAAYLSINENVTLYFEDTKAARVFLSRALLELRRVERGDLPYNSTDDKIEVPA